ncbi:CPBP family intramembrane glutamic endopeptidase [Actinoplanes sp. NPDC049265]|uniref:CPBP family intramembrane glutamic endopeptidase n=1 Tax=Actinoplanes sp. NPDC049265 TaxID=3363902 RepID=UPI0037106A02
MSYHLLAAGRPAWQHLIGILTVGVGWLIGSAVIYGVGDAAGLTDPRLLLALDFAAVAALLPATWLTVRVLQRRGLGTLSSVAGRLRWGWLARCATVAAPVAAVLLVAGLWVDPAGGHLVGAGAVVRTLAALLLLVPLQAAAEEYAFRGYLLQAFASLHPAVLRDEHPRTVQAMWPMPWVPILLQAVMFAAMHGWGTPWGFADLVAFGAVAGWLTVRTGGLEAGIALHVLNNLAAAVQMALLGQLRIDETAADLPWPMVAIDVPVLVIYAAVITRLARRVTPAGPVEPVAAPA